MSCFVKVQGIKTLVEQFYSNGPPTTLESTVVLAAEDDGNDLMSKAGKLRSLVKELKTKYCDDETTRKYLS